MRVYTERLSAELDIHLMRVYTERLSAEFKVCFYCDMYVLDHSLHGKVVSSSEFVFTVTYVLDQSLHGKVECRVEFLFSLTCI